MTLGTGLGLAVASGAAVAKASGKPQREDLEADFALISPRMKRTCTNEFSTVRRDSEEIDRSLEYGVHTVREEA